ncbi:hypothetical protein GGR51DRAFT_561858 [Nemania sp. FL0031]|nr:hypothetical protein GGR51DRAFT_561858 [Nemania sp. FL0031]
MSRKNPYHILGVSPNDDLQTVKQAWHRLCLRYHPDKAGQTEETHERFVEIHNAYETIYREKTEYEDDFVHVSHGDTWSPFESPESESPDDAQQSQYQQSQYQQSQYQQSQYQQSQYQQSQYQQSQYQGQYSQSQNTRAQRSQYAPGQGNSNELNYGVAAHMIYDLNQALQSLLRQLRLFFARFSLVIPQSDRATWLVLGKCLRSLEETLTQSAGLLSHIRVFHESYWGQNAPTYAILNTLSDLIAKHDQMRFTLSRMESDARVVENASQGRRFGLLRVLVTHASLWDSTP